jgi:flavin reductase (DIM6/NTAB) family NADH-FMN oxidoreductase RutF
MTEKSLPLSQVYKLLEPGPVVLLSTAYKNKENVMTMSWHMMVDFEPPIVACVISDRNYSFSLLQKSKECVINIPTVDLAEKVVQIGNVSGKQVDKFEKFHLSREEGTYVRAPLLSECYANLECRVVNTKMVPTYGMFIVEVVKAWIHPKKKRPLMIHHCGKGVFVVDGKTLTLPSKKK